MIRKSISRIRVRYGETDQMGVVHHGKYANYFEVARIEWLGKFGVSYKELEESGVMLPVYEMKLKYRKPAYFDDLLEVEVVLREQPTARIAFDYIIKNESGEVLTLGETTLVFTDTKTMRPMRCPHHILEALGFT